MIQSLEFLKNLSYRRYDVHIKATDVVLFDAWIGAVIRNNLLYAAEQIRIQKTNRSLREQIDVFPLAEDHPLYSELKEGFPKGYVLTNFTSANNANPFIPFQKVDAVAGGSHPYVSFQKVDSFSFSLLLIGRFNDYRFYFFEAIRQMCERGFGKPLTPFSLIDILEHPSSPVALSNFIENTSSPATLPDSTEKSSLSATLPDSTEKSSLSATLPDSTEKLLSTATLPDSTEKPSPPVTLSDSMQDVPSEITIRYLTPVMLYRLKEKKNAQLSYQDKTNRFPSFYQLIRSTFSRLQKLYALYENPSEKHTAFFDDACLENYLEKAGRSLLKSANIQHISLPNTQKKGMKNELPLTGYIGEQTYFGLIQQYVPLLRFMADLGVGNETVYGMGRFEIEAQVPPNRITENQKIEVANEISTLEGFIGEEKDENQPKMVKLPQLTIRFKNHTNLSENPLFAKTITQSSIAYAYPLIQCKRINGRAAIICIGEGTEQIGGFFASTDSRMYDGEKEIDTIKAETITIQTWNSDFAYSIRKYLPFSNENYAGYQAISDIKMRYRFIEKFLTHNLLFFAKQTGIQLVHDLLCTVTELEEKAKVKYKNHTFASFDLRFRTNLSLPNYIGLGIGVSHGFGTVARYSTKKICNPIAPKLS